MDQESQELSADYEYEEEALEATHEEQQAIETTPPSETPQRPLVGCWIRVFIGIFVLVVISIIAAVFAYQDARDSWGQPLEIENYSNMSLITASQTDTSDVQRFLIRAESSGEVQRIMETVESHYTRQMDRCDRSYECIPLNPDSNACLFSEPSPNEVVLKHTRTNCYKERTHEMLGFVQYVRVQIYEGTLFRDTECETAWNVCKTDLNTCLDPTILPEDATISDGEKAALLEAAEVCRATYEQCTETNKNTCQIPAVYVEVTRGWDN